MVWLSYGYGRHRGIVHGASFMVMVVGMLIVEGDLRSNRGKRGWRYYGDSGENGKWREASSSKKIATQNPCTKSFIVTHHRAPAASPSSATTNFPEPKAKADLDSPIQYLIYQ